MIEPGSVLIVPLDSWKVWLEAYGAIAAVIFVGFIVQRYGYGDDETPERGFRFVRVLGSASVVGALWPLWAAIAGIGLILACAV